MMPKNKRLLVLGLLLLLVIGAAIRLSFADTREAAVIESTDRIAAQAVNKPVISNVMQAELPLDRLSRSSPPVGDINPFSPKSWYVAPPPPPPQKVAAPTAPPLPFSYVGKMEDEDGSWTIYLAKGSVSFIVKKGDTFDNNYRLEDLQNGNLIIQYLPLKMNQILPTSVAS